MTAVGAMLNQLRTISSGTTASIIDSTKYIVIDRALSKAAEWAVANPEKLPAPDNLCFADVVNVIKTANGK